MNPRKQRALAALLTSSTQDEAAKKAGVCRRTLHTYMKDPEFKDAYAAACRDMVKDATRQAQATMEPALAALRAIIEDEEEATYNKISAARAVLEYSLKLTEIHDILGYIEEGAS